jgi:enoyl-CoA hydratase/carnithine racemase
VAAVLVRWSLCIGSSRTMTSAMPTQPTQIALEQSDGVLTITLDRPDQLNAFTGVMMNEMIAAFDHADADDSVRAVIVTGRGRGFCAGADLGAGAQTFDYDERPDRARPSGTTDRALRDGGGLLTLRIFQSTKPVIAAINGPAVGVGITMTLPMDIRLVSSTAKIGFVFARRGIVPEACSSWFLPRLVGISQAAEWCMTGRVFSAAEAAAGGLVRSVHEPDELLPAARAIALEIAQNTAPVSVALTRQMLWRMLGEGHPMAAHRVDSAGVSALGRLPDAKEGVMSFLEKRPPVYTMRPSADMPEFVPWWTEPDY